ncbi:hypothetical protein os1_17870 [Comamonadaceae bacterium OS-1]|nr:hypothetical protein os1_17870 [Comamonadaceae bacterium OS-1]
MLSTLEIAAVLAATKNAVDIFDKISGQIKGVLTKGPKEPEGGDDRWRYKVKADDKQITVKQDGHTIQTLNRDELESRLTPADLAHIKVYEASMQKYYKRWQQMYPMRDDSADVLANIKLDEQLAGQVKKMQQDLVGIVDFLQSIGVRLDDHYMQVRDLVKSI